jgi:protein deglycase
MPGAKSIADCVAFVDMLKKHRDAGKLYGAICAAPAVCLAPHGLIPAGAKATSHPGFTEKLQEALGADRCSEDRVVVQAEHKLVTSRGPGTAIEFALALASLLFDEQKAKDVAGPMLVK